MLQSGDWALPVVQGAEGENWAVDGAMLEPRLIVPVLANPHEFIQAAKAAAEGEPGQYINRLSDQLSIELHDGKRALGLIDVYRGDDQLSSLVHRILHSVPACRCAGLTALRLCLACGCQVDNARCDDRFGGTCGPSY